MSRAATSRASLWLVCLSLAWAPCLGCGHARPPEVAPPPPVETPLPDLDSGDIPGLREYTTPASARAPGAAAVPPRPARDPLAEPHAARGQAALWRDGRQVALLDAADAAAEGLLLLDVGTAWVPSLLRSTPELPHAYEPRFVELANERFDDTPEGRRARRDRFLELYGIPPTPAVLAGRMASVLARECDGKKARAVLATFHGVAWDEEGDEPREPVDPAVAEAIQARLRCDGHLRSTPSGQLDLKTRWALEEFERRHRIYARGSLLGKTLEALKLPAAELERRALLRVLTERLVLDLGIIEDGSGSEATPSAAVANEPRRDAEDVVSRLERRLEAALGLTTLEGARELYRRLEGALDEPHYILAIDPIDLPDYYAPRMDLFVEIDRGDVYYDFPYDEDGAKREQPKEHYPTLTLYARRDGVVIPLARYGTTIGGWRILRQGDRDVFAYKESPVGPRLWKDVVSAPVWLPPASTPPTSLVLEAREDVTGELAQEINENLVGPSYASAYGLVAAYHRRVERGPNGSVTVGRDEGIRTHGSSDYTSIWRRASLGCHRLHNHLALRLFSFVLAHRAHRRRGHGQTRFEMPVTLGSFSTVIQVRQTGYTFELDTPLPVEVLRGRILGHAKHAPRRRIPADKVLQHGGTS